MWRRDPKTSSPGARCILTPTQQTNPQALELVATLWQEAGAIVLTMDPHLHDKILGAVSHLPHVAAFALMNALDRYSDAQVPCTGPGRPLGRRIA